VQIYGYLYELPIRIYRQQSSDFGRLKIKFWACRPFWWAFPCGRALRYNLFAVKKPKKVFSLQSLTRIDLRYMIYDFRIKNIKFGQRYLGIDKSSKI